MTRHLLRVVSDGVNHRVEMPDGTELPGVRAVIVRPLLPGKIAVAELEALVELDVQVQLPGVEGQAGSGVDRNWCAPVDRNWWGPCRALIGRLGTEPEPEQKPWRQCLTPEKKSDG